MAATQSYPTGRTWIASHVLVISGNVQQAVHDEVQGAGAAGFLSKPFTLEELGRALTRFSQG